MSISAVEVIEAGCNTQYSLSLLNLLPSSMPSSRKRRRASSDSIVPQANQRDNGASWSGKELDVWEAFREEYVESVEQLPLSLHRNFSLLNEIDAQAHVLESELLPKISEYIRDRGIAQGLRGTPIEGNGQNTPSSLSCGTGSSRVIPQAFLSTDCRKVFQGRAEPFHTDKLLPDISIHINELLRATEEKVNLAQATYDSIDRHVRLLDQAIREHELRSKNDPPTARNKLRPFPITGLRATRLKDSADSLGTVALSNGQRRVERNARTYVASRSQRVSGTHSPSTVNPIPSSDKDLNSNRQSTRIIKGDVTVDATENATSWPNLISTDAGSAVVLSAVDMPIDPNEPRYCYCGQVSWGEMIACDAAGCEREWFHLGCVGLAEAPKRSKWYCDVCKENNLLGARRRG